MPTVFIIFGYRFSFFSNDHEPIHIHIYKGDAEAKYNLVPEVNIVSNYGFKNSELKLIESIIEENKDIIISRWNEFFKNKND